MKLVAVTVLGTDRPGIVCEVTELFAELGCNVENASQTVLQDEFSGIFVLTLPLDLDLEALKKVLEEELIPLGLTPFLKVVEPKSGNQPLEVREPFVVTCFGPDKVGLIAAVTCVMKKFGVNITNLQFASRSQVAPGQTVTIYQVDVPKTCNLSEFVSQINEKSKELGLEIAVQHKRIFEDICRL